jgi:hypothetical protein
VGRWCNHDPRTRGPIGSIPRAGELLAVADGLADAGTK